MSILPDHELYAQKQFRHNHGYALFYPDPCGDYDRVRVGDVGYVSDGKFMRLFNAFREADDPVNRGATLPDNFVPIGETFRSLSFSRSLQPGPKTSGRVRVFRVEGALSVPWSNAPVSAGARMKLQCEQKTGAALLMHYPAHREKAIADKAMHDYIVANCKSWVTMTRRQGRLLHLNDLVFVRDCTLTGDWATVVWDEVSFSSELTFSIGAVSLADASVSMWGSWEEQGCAPSRRGPTCTDQIREAYQRLEFDQCIFFKGLRIAQREWYKALFSIVKVKNADEGVFDIDDPSGPTVMRFFKRSGFKVETVGNRSSTFRPVQDYYDLIAIFIFENSDADVAVVDDNDLNMFSHDQMNSLESMCEALISTESIRVFTSASVEGGKEKVGRISRHDPEPSVFSEQDLIVLDEYNQPLHEDVLFSAVEPAPAPAIESSTQHEVAPSSSVDPVSSPTTEPSPQYQESGPSVVVPVVSPDTGSSTKSKESETKKHKKRSSEYKSRSSTSYVPYYSQFSSTESEVIATPPSRPSGVGSSSVGSETTHKGSSGQPSSSDDRVVIHVCEGPADECPQCLGAIPSPEENPSLVASLTEALEELSTNDFMDEFA